MFLEYPLLLLHVLDRKIQNNWVEIRHLYVNHIHIPTNLLEEFLDIEQ